MSKSLFKAFVPLEKVDDEKRMVYGYASTAALDSQGERISVEAMKAALPGYMQFANIREMHQLSAVGVAKSAEVDERGIYLGAHVVDDSAWEKVKAGVYKGFSIGGRALNKVGDMIDRLLLTEISLVDRPANPECVFDTWKADGAELAKAEAEEGAQEGAQEGAGGENVGGEGVDTTATETGAQEPASGEGAAKAEGGAGADGGEPVAKAGARFSAATKDALRKAHDALRAADAALAALGYADDGETGSGEPDGDEPEARKAQGPDLLAKALADYEAKGAELAKAHEELTKAHEELAKAHGDLNQTREELAALKAQPAPAKGATMVVGKAQDTGGGGDSLAKTAQEIEADPNLTPEQKAQALIKAQFSNPSAKLA